MLALGVTAALAVVGVAPDGGHAWFSSLQTVINAASDSVKSNGGHAWF